MALGNITRGAAFAGVFLLGLAAGGIITSRKMVQPVADLAALASESYAGNEAYVRYRYGSYAVAKAALLENAERLQQASNSRRGDDQRAARVDLGLTYGRLAVAAERAAHQDEARSYMKLAVQAFATVHGAASEQQVRDAVQRLDRSWDKRLTVLESGGDSSTNQSGAANRSQPVRSEANQTSAAAGSGR